MERRTFITVATGIGATLAGCSESTNGNGGNENDSDEEIANRAEGIESTLTAFYNAWLHGDAEQIREYLHEPRAWPREDRIDTERNDEFNEDFEVEAVEIQDWAEESEDSLRSTAEDSDLLDEADLEPIIEADTWGCVINIELSGDVNPETSEQERRVNRVEDHILHVLSWQNGMWKILQ